jgi:hypothetical protein
MAATQTREARLAIAVYDDFEKGMLDSLSDPLVVPKWLRENDLWEYNRKGENYKWDVVTDRPSVGAMSPAAQFSFTPTNPGIQPSLGWKGYRTTDLVHELDLAVAEGKQQIFDILNQRLTWMPEAVARAMNTEFYSGDGSTDSGFGANGWVGLTNAIVTTGTYAGIAMATHTAFNGQVDSAAPHTSFSTDPFPSLVDAFLQCYRGSDAGMGEYRPTHCFTDVTNFGYILNAANDLRQSVQHEKNAKLGTETVRFMGVEIIMDRFATANRLFVVNKDFICAQTPFKQPMQTRRKEELSPLSISLLCFTYSRLVVKLPRAHARITTA